MFTQYIKHALADFSVIEITSRILLAYIMGIFIGWEESSIKSL